MTHLICLILIGLTWSGLAHATIRHVPNDYATIQAALDVVANGDTVLVAPGVYVEALYTPPRQFVLQGEVAIDSTGGPWAIFDPTDLPDSPALRCVTMDGGHVTYSDIVFRNRPAMTDGRSDGETAGIEGDTTVIRVTLRRCIFDGVHGGIRGIDDIQVTRCRFQGCLSSCITTPLSGGRLEVDSSYLERTGAASIIRARSGGRIEDNVIVGHGGGRLITGIGDSLQIGRCYFTCTSQITQSALLINPKCRSKISECVFDGIHATDAVVTVTDSCYDQPKGWECAISIVRNRFVRCGTELGPPTPAGPMINVRCPGPTSSGFIAFLDSNIVDSTRRVTGSAFGLYLQASCEVKNCVISGSGVQNVPQIFVECYSGVDTLYFRQNSLTVSHPGLLRAPDETSLVDARDNWWGHPSGPYNEGANPGGLGARVGDEIAFIPWLTANPDTTHDDTSEVAVEAPPGVLASYSLRAYPNPFNAMTMLEIEVVMPGEYDVILYDVTGRETARVFSGRIERSTRVALNASEFASGVYFVKLARGSEMFAVEKVLLVK